MALPLNLRDLRIAIDKYLTSLDERISRDIVEGSTIEEVVDGREGETTIRDNLNKNYARKEDLEAVSGGAPTEVFTTLANLESTYPDGAPGIFVVTENGNWYYWNGSAWTSGGAYQSTEWLDVITEQNETWEV